MRKKIIIVTGPTAVGKTEYTIELAEKIDAEIISCDSMQLYKYLDIGSAKPTPEELARVKHYLVDEIDPAEHFSAAKYRALAGKAIDTVLKKGKIPIVTGGTGLYMDSLIYDMDFGPSPEAGSEERRAALIEYASANGNEALHCMLAAADPGAAERIHPNNVKRVARALEAAERGEPLKPYENARKRPGEYETVLIGLKRDRKELYERINKRVDILIELGLVDEVRSLADMGFTSDDISMKGIGYKEIFDHLDGKCTLEEAVETVKRNTRRFAKRQMTWFKKYDEMKWFDLTGRDSHDINEELFEWVRKKL